VLRCRPVRRAIAETVIPCSAVSERYGYGNRAERGRILDEFAAVTGLHRKRAMCPLRRPSRRSGVPSGQDGGYTRRYADCCLSRACWDGVRAEATSPPIGRGRRWAVRLAELIVILELHHAGAHPKGDHSALPERPNPGRRSVVDIALCGLGTAAHWQLRILSICAAKRRFLAQF
jgi:hypothetical protein